MTETRRTITHSPQSTFFVWLKTNKGPVSQKWYGDQTRGTGQFQRGEVGTGDLLAFHVLSPEEALLGLGELEKRYSHG